MEMVGITLTTLVSDIHITVTVLFGNYGWLNFVPVLEFTTLDFVEEWKHAVENLVKYYFSRDTLPAS